MLQQVGGIGQAIVDLGGRGEAAGGARGEAAQAGGAAAVYAYSRYGRSHVDGYHCMPQQHALLAVYNVWIICSLDAQ